jgi:Arc/MetJ-type ribon-helix-helix transcriptional regulator
MSTQSNESGETTQERVSARVSDPELVKVLQGGESKSEVLRDALRALAEKEESTGGLGLAGTDLDDEQRRAYRWLVDRFGLNETTSLEVVKVELAQELGKKKELITHRIIKPLDREGLVRVRSGIEIVRVTVLAPGDTNE